MPRGDVSVGRPVASASISESEVAASSAAGSESDSVSLSQATRALATFSTDDVNKRVNDLVQFLLVADQKKVPIKRQDISKHVLKEMSRGFATMMDQAKKKLLEVFGIKLVELDGKHQTYILINKFDSENEDAWSPEENARSALVSIILGVIFMSGNVVHESIVWSMLKKLGVAIDTPDPVFKDAKKLVTQDFVKQGYLCYERVPNTDPVEYEFTWGDRAKLETSKMHILEFVSKIFDNMAPQTWTQQYADASASR